MKTKVTSHKTSEALDTAALRLWIKILLKEKGE